jgi:hypothetical protein
MRIAIDRIVDPEANRPKLRLQPCRIWTASCLPLCFVTGATPHRVRELRWSLLSRGSHASASIVAFRISELLA